MVAGCLFFINKTFFYRRLKSAIMNFPRKICTLYFAVKSENTDSVGKYPKTVGKCQAQYTPWAYEANLNAKWRNLKRCYRKKICIHRIRRKRVEIRPEKFDAKSVSVRHLTSATAFEIAYLFPHFFLPSSSKARKMKYFEPPLILRLEMTMLRLSP